MAKEPVDAMLVSQARRVDMQVRPVDRLNRQSHMTLDDLGNAMRYHPLAPLGQVLPLAGVQTLRGPN